MWSVRELVAGAPHREHELRTRRVTLDLSPQPADRRVNTANGNLAIAAPKPRQERQPTEHDARPRRERVQEIEFRPREIHRGTANDDAAPLRIDHKTMRVDSPFPGPRFNRRVGAAQDGADPGHELAGVERSRETVVCAAFKHERPIRRSPVGHQHHDWRGGVLPTGPNGAADRDAVDVSVCSIQDDQVEAFMACPINGRRAISGFADVEPLACELTPKPISDYRVTLDNEGMPLGRHSCRVIANCALPVCKDLLSRSRGLRPTETPDNQSKCVVFAAMMPHGHSSSALSDHALFTRAASGDLDAFTTIYHRYQQIVYRFGRVMTGSSAAAEDVTQEVFVALLTTARRYDPSRAAFSTYLYGIVRNLSRVHLREEGRFMSVEALDLESELVCEDDPLSRMERADTVSSIRRALDRLPPRCREPVILCDLHGLSYQEAATIVGASVGSVRSRLHRGRLLLRLRLTPIGYPIVMRPAQTVASVT
jgi:RNA polymerase sigma-70 factor, ECF subfamily